MFLSIFGPVAIVGILEAFGLAFIFWKSSIIESGSSKSFISMITRSGKTDVIFMSASRFSWVIITLTFSSDSLFFKNSRNIGGASIISTFFI